MKQVMAAVVIASYIAIGVIGCSKVEKSSTKEERKITTPSGTTTISTETDVKKTGEKPPDTSR